jgi:MYXO-CTERM domain-containing protein
VHGDGTTLYTGKSFGANQPFSVSPETDGVTWKPFNTQMFPDGPYEMAYDAQNGILYSSNWSSGVWALKVGDGAGVPAPAGGGACPPGGAAGTGGATGTGGAVTGSGGGGVSGSGGGAAGSGAPAVTGGDGGCACDMSATGLSGPGLLFSVLGLGVVLSRRRRRIGSKMTGPPS